MERAVAAYEDGNDGYLTTTDEENDDHDEDENERDDEVAGKTSAYQ